MASAPFPLSSEALQLFNEVSTNPCPNVECNAFGWRQNIGTDQGISFFTNNPNIREHIKHRFYSSDITDSTTPCLISATFKRNRTIINAPGRQYLISAKSEKKVFFAIKNLSGNILAGSWTTNEANPSSIPASTLLLEHEIIRAISRQYGNSQVLHGALLSSPVRPLILIGESGAGKTCTAIAISIQNSNFKLIGDDLIFLSLAGQIYSAPKRIAVKANGKALLDLHLGKNWRKIVDGTEQINKCHVNSYSGVDLVAIAGKGEYPKITILDVDQLLSKLESSWVNFLADENLFTRAYRLALSGNLRGHSLVIGKPLETASILIEHLSLNK